MGKNDRRWRPWRGLENDDGDDVFVHLLNGNE